MKPSILFHRGTEWSAEVRGSTNILASLFLQDGYPVTWVTRPFHVGHIFRQMLKNNESRLETNTERTPDGALVIRPFTVIPILKAKVLGSRLWAASARLGYSTIYPRLPIIFEKFGQPSPDLIWTTGGDAGVLRKNFPGARQIVQCVDVYEAYAGSVQNRLEINDYRNADAVVAIGYSLAAYLQRNRGVPDEKINVIGQGADLELFSKQHREPADLVSVQRPRLVWVGVLAKADPNLMKAALAELPVGTGSLVLIGPQSEWVRSFAESDSRVVFLGPRPAHEAAAYLQHCDVGLMLYDRNRNQLQYEGQNPLKLYEMAAAGLPIISTSHQEYRYSANPALIADTPAAVADAVRDALVRSDRLAEEARKFAQLNGWRQRFQEAKSLVRQVIEIGR